MDAAAAELRRNPVSMHQIQPDYGNEQADAGRDCRTRLARLHLQARTRTGKCYFFPVQLTTCRIGNLNRLMHTLALCVTIQYTIKNHPRVSTPFPETYIPVNYLIFYVCMYVFIKLHLTTQSGPVILVILCHSHVCMYVFIKLHITTQSGPVILVILCHSH